MKNKEADIKRMTTVLFLSMLNFLVSNLSKLNKKLPSHVNNLLSFYLFAAIKVQINKNYLFIFKLLLSKNENFECEKLPSYTMSQKL